jgi:hypothetical protein
MSASTTTVTTKRYSTSLTPMNCRGDQLTWRTTSSKDPRLLIHEDLWKRAVDELPNKEKETLELLKGNKVDDIIEDALALTKSSEEKVKQRGFKIKGRNGEVPLRYYIDKFAKALKEFKEVGDVLVQYDPGHAALPWASVRFLLNVSTGPTLDASQIHAESDYNQRQSEFQRNGRGNRFDCENDHQICCCRELVPARRLQTQDAIG